jgi:hypothetical protein
MRSLTQIANEALAELPAHAITSLDDGSREAQECSKFLPGIVSELIGYHDWSFVRRRVALAEVTNDRPGEWDKAYALPANIASAIELVRPQSSTLGLSYATGEGLSIIDILVTPVLYWPTTQLPHAAIDYEIANGVLYTDLVDATLEHSIDALLPETWPALFQKAVICALASRIYKPLMGAGVSFAEIQPLMRMAMYARDEAVADDMNRNPRERKAFVSEGAAARAGVTGGVQLWRR